MIPLSKSELLGNPLSREEWDVALDGGGLFRIFNDRLRGTWFVDGELD